MTPTVYAAASLALVAVIVAALLADERRPPSC